MLVSYNELQVECYKAFTGLNRKSGESDKIANTIANNEIIGLYGVNLFAKALQYLQQDNDSSIHLEINNNIINVDLNHCSIIVHIDILLDKALEVLQNEMNVVINIRNVYNRYLTIGALFDLLKYHKNLNITAKWTTNTQHTILCVFQSGELYPDVYYQSINDDKKQFLTITINKEQISANIDTNYIKHSKQKLKNYYLNCIKNGIDVDSKDFAIINKFAQAILVKETIQSYKDAGE